MSFRVHFGPLRESASPRGVFSPGVRAPLDRFDGPVDEGPRPVGARACTGGCRRPRDRCACAGGVGRQTDVPAAAMVAVCCGLGVAPAPRFGRAAIALAALGAVLTKQQRRFSLPLLFALLVRGRGALRARFQGPAGALAAGLALGLTYDFVMALRFHEGLIAYLRTGSTGVYAQFAAQARGDALLRADVLGPGLRLPLTFGLLYAGVRVARVRHRPATAVALAGGLLWSIAGTASRRSHQTDSLRPRRQDSHWSGSRSSSPRPSFCPTTRRGTGEFSGLVLSSLSRPLSSGSMPPRTRTGSLPRLAWAGGSGGSRPRCRGQRPRTGRGTDGFSPIRVIALAIWMSMSTFDGLHGPIWQEYRALWLERTQQSDAHDECCPASCTVSIGYGRAEPRQRPAHLRRPDLPVLLAGPGHDFDTSALPGSSACTGIHLADRRRGRA